MCVYVTYVQYDKYFLIYANIPKQFILVVFYFIKQVLYAVGNFWDLIFPPIILYYLDLSMLLQVVIVHILLLLYSISLFFFLALVGI